MNLLRHVFAAAEKPQTAHHCHVRGAEPAQREYAEPTCSKDSQQGTVFELAHDPWPQALRFEPAIESEPQRRVTGGQEHGQTIQ